MQTIQTEEYQSTLSPSPATLSVDAAMPRGFRPKLGSKLNLSQHSVIFSGASQNLLADRLCQLLGTSSANLILKSFPNSETRIEIHESVRNRHAFVVACINSPVNEGLMQTVLLVQALKLADAQKVTVILPYFPYSRQDRKADIRPPISAKVVSDILKTVGAHQIISIDLHATQVEGFFDGPFENLSGLNQLVLPVLNEEGGNLIVVSPDAGGAKRAENFSRQVEKISGNFTPLLIMSKFRATPGQAPQVILSAGEELLKGKTCVLVDDMIDTGGSIIAAARVLKEKGARRVIVCAAHAVFSDHAVEKLANSQLENGERIIDRVYVTDTLHIEKISNDFLRIISIAPLLAEAIRRLDQPLGTLRELNDRNDLGVALSTTSEKTAIEFN